MPGRRGYRVGDAITMCTGIINLQRGLYSFFLSLFAFEAAYQCISQFSIRQQIHWLVCKISQDIMVCNSGECLEIRSMNVEINISS